MVFHGDKKEGTWLLANAENKLKDLQIQMYTVIPQLKETKTLDTFF